MKISYPYSDFYPHSCGQYKHVQVSNDQKIIKIYSTLPEITTTVTHEIKKKKYPRKKAKGQIYVDRCIIENSNSYTIRIWLRGKNTTFKGFKTLEEAKQARDKLRADNPEFRRGPKVKI